MPAPTIFQVEDDEDLSFFMDHAIKEISRDISLTIVANGDKGIGLLNEYRENNRKPGLILLDINLPGMSGIELLKTIREIPFFKSVPIVVFSTSDNPRDFKAALEFGANEFQTKPLGYRELVNRLKVLIAKYIYT